LTTAFKKEFSIKTSSGLQGKIFQNFVRLTAKRKTAEAIRLSYGKYRGFSELRITKQASHAG
jgi:hypothetical protein